MSNRHTIVTELLWPAVAAEVAEHMDAICDQVVSAADGNVLAGFARGWQINADTNPIPLDWLFAKLQPKLKHDVRFAILTADGGHPAITVRVGPSGIADMRADPDDREDEPQVYTAEEMTTNIWLTD